MSPLVHFIGTELRPDLVQSALRREPDPRSGDSESAEHGKLIYVGA
jgi:hypothetical protein